MQQQLEDLLPLLTDKIDSYSQDVIEYQSRLTAIPALGPENGGHGEIKKAELIKGLLEVLNPDVLEDIQIPDDRVECGFRPNLIAKWRSAKKSTNTVWILSHMDVVPAGDLAAWDTDPFVAVEKNGKIYGRGVEDNQQSIVSSLLAIKALKDLKITPQTDVGLAIVADEENGSKFGIEAVLKSGKDLFSKNDLILIPDSGDSEGILIEIAEKSVLWVRVEVKGKQTHASVPENGINAHRAGAKLLLKMDTLNQLFSESDQTFLPPTSTFEPTKKENNVDNINTIPGSDVFYFDCRVLPQIPLQSIKDKINEFAAEIEKEYLVQVSVSYSQENAAPPPTPADSPVVKALSRAVLEVTGKTAKTIGIGGGTVAAHFREVGLPAVCWCTVDDTLHEPNEYCITENVLTDAKVFAHLFLQG